MASTAVPAAAFTRAKTGLDRGRAGRWPRGAMALNGGLCRRSQGPLGEVRCGARVGAVPAALRSARRACVAVGSRLPHLRPSDGEADGCTLVTFDVGAALGAASCIARRGQGAVAALADPARIRSPRARAELERRGAPLRRRYRGARCAGHRREQAAFKGSRGALGSEPLSRADSKVRDVARRQAHSTASNLARPERVTAVEKASSCSHAYS